MSMPQAGLPLGGLPVAKMTSPRAVSTAGEFHTPPPTKPGGTASQFHTSAPVAWSNACILPTVHGLSPVPLDSPAYTRPFHSAGDEKPASLGGAVTRHSSVSVAMSYFTRLPCAS